MVLALCLLAVIMAAEGRLQQRKRADKPKATLATLEEGNKLNRRNAKQGKGIADDLGPFNDDGENDDNGDEEDEDEDEDEECCDEDDEGDDYTGAGRPPSVPTIASCNVRLVSPLHNDCNMTCEVI